MNFLRVAKKRCQGCGEVLPKKHATVSVRHADGVSEMLICESCERVMEELHELSLDTNRVDTVDED